MTQRLVARPAGKSFFGSADLLPAQASLTYAIWQKSPTPLHADSGYFITGLPTSVLLARERVKGGRSQIQMFLGLTHSASMTGQPMSPVLRHGTCHPWPTQPSWSHICPGCWGVAFGDQTEAGEQAGWQMGTWGGCQFEGVGWDGWEVGPGVGVLGGEGRGAR